MLKLTLFLQPRFGNTTNIHDTRLDAARPETKAVQGNNHTTARQAFSESPDENAGRRGSGTCRSRSRAAIRRRIGLRPIGERAVAGAVVGQQSFGRGLFADPEGGCSRLPALVRFNNKLANCSRLCAVSPILHAAKDERPQQLALSIRVQNYTPACFAAKSPITGSLKYSPLLAFRIANSQAIKNATPIPRSTSTNSRPTKGIKCRTICSTVAATHTATHATCSAMHWIAWNRTSRILLYGSITRKMIAGIIVM